MNYIKLNSSEAAEALQALINDELTKQISGYNAIRWTNPIKHQTEEQYLVDMGEGRRNEVILAVISPNSEIVDIDREDENWFPKPKDDMLRGGE